MTETGLTGLLVSTARDATALVTDAGIGLESACRGTVALLSVVGFWTAIVLPFTYVPVLYVDLAPGGVPVVLGLVAVNVVALVVGHDHRPESR